jgi:FO synthase subunit 2
MEAGFYADLTRAVKAAAPGLHLHAFSPEEIKFGAGRARTDVRTFLTELREAGLDTLPGTSAEILDDEVRARLGPGRISTRQWVEVIRTAHEVGLRTTSTMMFGHVESWAHRIAHLSLLRDIQRDTGGFTEFVPLSFVHEEAPLTLRAQTSTAAVGGPHGDDVLRLYAMARLMLGATFTNIQASWVKEGFRTSQILLSCGVNDLGGTLMNESISTAAGAQNGQLATPARLRALIRGVGRPPRQRTTTYGVVRDFGIEPAEGEGTDESLNAVTDAEAVFGSYERLTLAPAFRYDPANLHDESNA